MKVKQSRKDKQLAVRHSLMLRRARMNCSNIDWGYRRMRRDRSDLTDLVVQLRAVDKRVDAEGGVK